MLSNSNGYGSSNNNNTINYAKPTKRNNEKPRATAEEIEPQLKASCLPDWTGPRSCEHFTNTAYGENIELSNVAIH